MTEAEILRGAADILHCRGERSAKSRDPWEENLGDEEPEAQLFAAAEVCRVEAESDEEPDFGGRKAQKGTP